MANSPRDESYLNARVGRFKGRCHERARSILSVAISADGDCVVAGGDDGYVSFFKNARSLIGTPSPTWMSVLLSGPVERKCLDISDDGNYVVACGTGRWVFYWANAKGLSGNNKIVSWQSRIFDNVMSVDL